MLARRDAHARLKFRGISALAIGLMLMLLLPQPSSAVVIFVVFDGYGPLARLVVAQDDHPIRRLHQGRLFDVPSAADDPLTRHVLSLRPGGARWNVLAEAPLTLEDMEDDLYVIGSNMESILTLERDITQVDASSRRRHRNRRQLLEAWALLTVANQRPLLYVNDFDIYADAMNLLAARVRGMATYSQILPVLRIRSSIFHASLENLPGTPYLYMAVRPSDLPPEMLHFATALYQRDQAIVARIPVSRPAIPLPINSAAGRIVALIVGYIVGEPVFTAPNAGNFIAIFEALMTPLRPSWRAQWTRPVFLYPDPTVTLQRQEDQAQAWGLNLLPGSVGRSVTRMSARMNSVD